MNSLKVQEEFVVGKHSIGFVSSDFKTRFGHESFNSVTTPPTFQKLPRSMNDTEIEGELKPGFCTLGDILAFMDAPSEETRDGYYNLFYTPSFVVYGHWRSVSGRWSVNAWGRGGDRWGAGDRVFSPALRISESQSSDPLKLEPSDLSRIVTALERIADGIELLTKPKKVKNGKTT